jgi:nitrogen-specific signal transduction histidine kinase/ActR/RegA family two-component response regulator
VYVLATIVDITARKRHEEETRKLESRLRQSEKLEAIGQLAGGVAHDFNNILTAILGYVEATQAQLEVSAVDPTEFHNALEQIKKSALSAAELTRQLLAFGRRQLARPRPLNLNEAVRSVEPMLRRLLPENVAVELHLAPDVRNTLADPSQVEQVIVNLVVNARDAMPTGGSLTIRTENAQLDDRYALLHPEVLPGEYVALVVSDVGCGMASATMARIFDPFFTTKAAGQGTGMGLSTVYGIVKQAKGHVSVYSEVGKGTTFKIFLPAEAASVAAAASMRTPDASTPQGTETILVAEDNELVRWVIQNILRGAGYNLLLAANGTEALRLADEHQGRIDMLVTDVVMPDIHGKDLAERLLARGLAPKVLFLSGYTSDVIAHHGVLEPGLALLEKPFTRQALLQRVRQLLDAPTAGPVSTAALSSVEPTADRSEV